MTDELRALEAAHAAWADAYDAMRAAQHDLKRAMAAAMDAGTSREHVHRVTGVSRPTIALWAQQARAGR
jgi:hypothetical protein